MSNYANLPAPSPEQGLNRYLQEIRKFPMLEPENIPPTIRRHAVHFRGRAPGECPLEGTPPGVDSDGGQGGMGGSPPSRNPIKTPG